MFTCTKQLPDDVCGLPATGAVIRQAHNGDAIATLRCAVHGTAEAELIVTNNYPDSTVGVVTFPPGLGR